MTPPTQFAQQATYLTFPTFPQAKAPQNTALQNVEALFITWIEGICTHDIQMLVSLYAGDAMLLPTLSNVLAGSPAQRAAYFAGIMKRENLHVTVKQHRARLLTETIATISGMYTFSFTEQGAVQLVPARFTFVLQQQRNGEWRIEEHHSSALPA